MAGVSRVLAGAAGSGSPAGRGAWSGYRSKWAAIESVAAKIGVSVETLRAWVRQVQVDGGQRPGMTLQESAEVKRLRRENAKLRRANEILKAAAAFFGAELDRPQPRW